MPESKNWYQERLEIKKENALKFESKIEYVPPIRVLNKKLFKAQKNLLPKLKVAGVMKVEDLLKKWQELYYRVYGTVYPISGKEKGMMKILCRESSQRLIICSFVTLFLEYLGDPFFTSRKMVPSLSTFLRKADFWKSKALLLEEFMDLNSLHWFVINQAGADLSKLAAEVTVLKAEVGLDGDVYVTFVKDRRLEVIKTWKTQFTE